MKLISTSLIYLAIIQIVFWSWIPQISEGRCKDWEKIKDGPKMVEPWREHVYAILAPFCYSTEDEDDDGLESFPKLMRRLISETPNGTVRHTALSEILGRFDQQLASSGGLIDPSDVELRYCANKTLTTNDLLRNVILSPAMQDIKDHSNFSGLPSKKVYTAGEMIEKLPEPDGDTKFGDSSRCRKQRFAENKCPVARQACGPLSNVPFMPPSFVNFMRYFCGIILSDVELNSDPEVARLPDFVDAIVDCKAEGFYEGIRCLPYNKTVRRKIQTHMATYLRNKKVFGVHTSRIVRSMLREIGKLVVEVVGRRGGKLLLEGGDCRKSFDYLDMSERFIKYMNSSPDGSFVFLELANFQTPEFMLVSESRLRKVFVNSCNFTLGLFCNDKCVCECSRGKGKCVPMESLAGNSKQILLNHLIVLVGSVILGFVGWTILTMFW